jgi:hypothetical protein
MVDAPGCSISGSHVTFNLEFAAAQSFFIVFRKPWSPASAIKRPSLTSVTAVSGSWDVHFDPRRGGPGAVEFSSLDDWTARTEKGIQYYSGTATYSKSVSLPPLGDGKLLLDLGSVKNLASITLNGKKVGVLWTAPWRIDISSAVIAGENRFEIAVTNVWANRLIGDEQEPADVVWEIGDPKMKGGYFLKEFPDWFLRKEPRPSTGRYTFTTWNYFHKKDSPLSPSGLLGPVRVIAVF